MKKALYRIFIAIVILVIIVNVCSIFNLSFFGFRTFRIGSGSMDPYLKVNDFIVIKTQDEYKVDDVVTYINADNNYVTHRIVYMDDWDVITKGDANNTKDAPIEEKDIVGKVVFRIRGLGFIMYLFSSYISWILLFVIGLVITMCIPDKEENNEERSDSDAGKEDSSEENNSEKDNNKDSGKKKNSKAKSSTRKTTTKKASSRKTSTTRKAKTIKKEIYCIPLFICTIIYSIL